MGDNCLQDIGSKSCRCNGLNISPIDETETNMRRSVTMLLILTKTHCFFFHPPNKPPTNAPQLREINYKQLGSAQVDRSKPQYALQHCFYKHNSIKATNIFKSHTCPSEESQAARALRTAIQVRSLE